MIRFEHPEALYLLFLLIPLTGVFLLFIYGRRKAIRRIGARNIWDTLMPTRPNGKHQIKFVLISLAIAFFIVALANPQRGLKAEKVKRKGVDLIVALDISRSMLAEDEKPNRLARSKQFISRLIDKLGGDRIGLIIFAGNAYLQVPLTSDYTAAKTFLRTITPNLAPTQGTAIGEAIRMAQDAFENADPQYKVILLLSDGENHEGDAMEATEEVAGKGVIIHTMGIGTAKGAPIPIYENQSQVDYKRDQSGSIVFSKLNEEMLQKISIQGNGKYFRLEQGNSEVTAVMQELASMEQKEFEEEVFTDYEDQYQGFLLIGLILLAIEYFISERRSRIFTEWSIFKTDTR